MDSTQSGSGSKTPQITKVLASKYDKIHIAVPVPNSVPEKGKIPSTFQETCKPSKQIQLQKRPKVQRARKTFPQSKNKLPITDGDDEKKNSEAIPALSSIGKSRSPVPNADSASVRSKVLCQESLPQPNLTPTPDNVSKSKVLPLVATTMSGSEQVTGTKVLAKKKTKSGLPREVTQLLQDEGAERIMQEMEGKLTSRKRTPTKGYFGDTGDTDRLLYGEDEKVQKKIKRPRTKSLTTPTADSFQFGRNSPQNVQVVKVSRFYLLIYLLYLRSDSFYVG